MFHLLSLKLFCRLDVLGDSLSHRVCCCLYQGPVSTLVLVSVFGFSFWFQLVWFQLWDETRYFKSKYSVLRLLVSLKPDALLCLF